MTTLGDELLELVNSDDIHPTPYQDPFTIIIKNFERDFAQEKKKAPQYEKWPAKQPAFSKWNGVSIDYANAMIRYYYNKNPKGEYFKHVLNKMIGFCKWWNNQTKKKNELTDTIQAMVDSYLSIKETDLAEIYSK